MWNVQAPSQIRTTDLTEEVRIAADDELVAGARQPDVNALS